MKFKKADKGVTEIVGTVLLLGMSISLFSILSLTVLSYPSSPSPPSVNLVATIEGNATLDGKYILIEHRGGEALSLETKVIITIGDDTPINIAIGDGDYLDNEAKKDNRWGIGEWFVYEDTNINGKTVTVTVVDVESNSMILTGALQSS